MDPTIADLIKAAYWPLTVVVVLVGFMLLFCRSIANRIRHAKVFDWSKKSAEFFEPQGAAAQVSIGESAPTLPSGAGTFDEAQAKTAIEILSTGWRFERIMRIIYPTQLELLFALRNGALFTDKEALPYYDKMPAELKVRVNYASFMLFLISPGLVHNDLSPTGEGRYSMTSVGLMFLAFRDQVANGVVFPEMNAFDIAAPEGLK